MNFTQVFQETGRRESVITLTGSSSNGKSPSSMPGEQGHVKFRRTQRRCVSKDGVCRFATHNVGLQKRKLWQDIFTTLLEIRWQWALLLFFGVYFGSWLVFATLWYSILFLHDDLDHYGDPDWRPCISGIDNFASVFLFSVETQHTTGYGFYQLGDSCPPAIFLFCIQSIVGTILEGMMAGLVFVRMTQTKRRSATIAFSRRAVICQRDGKLCFMFRVGDLRTALPLLQTQIRAQLVGRRVTLEGEVISHHQEELHINGSGNNAGRILLFWPSTVVHTIDEFSPLFHLHPGDLDSQNDSFEVIVVLEGTAEATGLVVQARTSYLPSEILWGHRFEELTANTVLSDGERAIDYSRFHNTYPVATTSLSAAELEATIFKSPASRRESIFSVDNAALYYPGSGSRF